MPSVAGCSVTDIVSGAVVVRALMTTSCVPGTSSVSVPAVPFVPSTYSSWCLRPLMLMVTLVKAVFSIVKAARCRAAVAVARMLSVVVLASRTHDMSRGVASSEASSKALPLTSVVSICTGRSRGSGPTWRNVVTRMSSALANAATAKHIARRKCLFIMFCLWFCRNLCAKVGISADMSAM